MEIKLVPMSQSPGEATQALTWALDLWGNHIPNYSLQDWMDFYSNSIESNYKSWTGQGQELVYLAKHGQALVGTIAIVDFDELEEFRQLKPWIAAFIVNPQMRGAGIGTQILSLLEDEARSLGIDVLHLWTEDQSNFYLKRGYQIVAPAILGEMEIYVMKKALNF